MGVANVLLIKKLRVEKEALLFGLREIAEGKGAYNEDKLIHASNVIGAMKEIASDLLKKYDYGKDGV